MTNHDYNSFVDKQPLSAAEKQELVNRLYAEHVEEIMKDPKLFILKLADLSININLPLTPDHEKHQKLKRKYKAVIEAVLEKLTSLDADHPLHDKREELIAELTKVYQAQYAY